MKTSVPDLQKLLLGSGKRNGILKIAVYYTVLFGVGFVFLYPVIYMLVNSFLSPDDLTDPAVYWIPTQLYFGSYIQAFKTLDFIPSFSSSLLMSAGPSVLQTACAALVGFGLARFRFPGRGLLLVLIVTTFIIPVQVTVIPRYVQFYSFGMLDTFLPPFLTSMLGQGIKSAVFILVFYLFFHSYPESFDEAAELDGAGKITIFYRIALPMSVSAIVLSLLLSFVWYWNETTQSALLFGSAIKTLPLQLQNFTARYEALYPVDPLSSADRLNESITLAGTLLSILPMLVLYMFLQRQFVESIERSGITGE